ncbi:MULTISPECIES: sugar ABC transporter ATP-binding protein [Treponema]|uniref:Galactose/methyl galactoside import ATP-binding protein MglA n=1 Tax=Treponema denticola (strain ATCC 35405 / DSM 14222 / CIP 103919 / JCM 8153 / KCTC 15104) TaxID=243275 RepID=MGLA_TREDE|nr:MULTISPECIES: sugar ABC transporter ATP-binding protein [Treponema]Q73KK2.1 RecName: Full=Galactose/methyl galactoside import ATP-binding protein MglA [Treponema denticola ATCC 35405]AAS12735.1 galactoside ABC transporter, ATP-binding protein [Treponema denticola ATCC 35405]EMB38723.1 galactose/methyl galactoside import ATP-binding protein MglA [Treponema denticola ATCC 35404]EMB39291.1 galactose/methyl galactoside import ATP-binding protein MglA [Treponema denticola ATCC 33521]HCY94773.1 s
MSDVVLEIKNLSKSFGKNKVLDGINLTVRQGSVMGLMGENGAGKSTMMKCLFGIYTRDEGAISLLNKSIEFKNPKEALESGVAMVHQELNLCLDRTVTDNLFLGRYPTNFGIVDEIKMFESASSLFSSLNMNVNPKTIMRTMSVSQRQMVEIAKAVSYNAKLIVLDEPTSSLTEREVKKLFSIIRALQKKGVSFIYISHKMDEVFEVCDEVAVLRDGKMILSKPVAGTNMNEIISAMVGRSLDKRFPDVDNVPGEDFLKIENLKTKYAPVLEDISFTVRKGEILGLYGLVGAGRSELLEALFGIRTIESGSISINDKYLKFKSSKEAMAHGFALLTEERKLNGMFGKDTIEFNTVITNLNNYKTIGVLSKRKIREAANREIETMRTRCLSADQGISALSGGNQQKVIIGKWLERSPDVFLMDEPTRGIDVGAKYEIYQLIIKMAKEGKTIIVVSSEMPEILGITNRIAVMSNRRLAGIVNTKETDQETLLRLSAKYL